MIAASVMVVEGVLAYTGRADSVADAAPIRQGISLYRSLRSHGEVVLHTEDDLDKVRTWLGVHLPGERPALFDGPKLDIVRRVRLRNYDLLFYVDASPAACAAVMRRGVPALLFAVPEYSRPEFRPDAPQRQPEWAELAGELASQRSMADTDLRRLADDADLHFDSAD